VRDDGNPLAPAPGSGPFPEDNFEPPVLAFGSGPFPENNFEPPTNLPPEADRLGPPRQEFRTKYGLGAVVFGVVLTVLPLVGSVAAVIWGVYCSFRSPSPDVGGFGIGLFILLSLPTTVAIVGVWCLRKGLAGMMNSRILLCGGGFVDCRYRRIEVCPWDEVDKVWRKVTVTPEYRGFGMAMGLIRHHRYRVRMKDGRQFSWNDDYRGVVRLGPRIEKEVYLRRFPAAIADLNAGRAVAFDAVVVTPHGLEVRGRTVAWDQIRAIKQKTYGGLDYVYVYICDRAGPWAKIAVHRIANFLVFLSVVQSLFTAKELPARPKGFLHRVFSAAILLCGIASLIVAVVAGCVILVTDANGIVSTYFPFLHRPPAPQMPEVKPLPDLRPLQGWPKRPEQPEPIPGLKRDK
jgi:hypothetical protein